MAPCVGTRAKVEVSRGALIDSLTRTCLNGLISLIVKSYGRL